jgi:6-pyruvoyl-tetrahydropterin synthase
MSKSNCIVLDRQEFFKKFDIFLLDNKNATMIMAFIDHQSLINQKLSKDYEAKLILDGWQQISQNFPFSFYCVRWCWRSYLILVDDQSSQIVPSLKKTFAVLEGRFHPNLWRMAFTYLKDSKDRTRRLAADLEWIAIKAAHYNTSEKLFQIHIDEKSQTPLTL